jgi:hypothetical protein
MPRAPYAHLAHHPQAAGPASRALAREEECDHAGSGISRYAEGFVIMEKQHRSRQLGGFRRAACPYWPAGAQADETFQRNWSGAARFVSK